MPIMMLVSTSIRFEAHLYSDPNAARVLCAALRDRVSILVSALHVLGRDLGNRNIAKGLENVPLQRLTVVAHGARRAVSVVSLKLLKG